MPPVFEILGERKLVSPAQRQLAAWCPTKDLIAYGLADQTVALYRMNGQKVWQTPKYTTGQRAAKKEHSVTQLCWRPDGKLLAVSYDNFVTRIIDVQTGRFGHQVEMEDPAGGRIAAIGWVDNRDPAAEDAEQLEPKTRTDFINVGGTLTDENLGYLFGLFNFDVSNVLPKLSVLPGVANADITFSSKQSLDSLINVPSVRKEDTMDVLLMGTSKGRFAMNVFDSFVVGSMDLSDLIGENDRYLYKITHHQSTRSLKTHLLLTTSTVRRKYRASAAEREGPTVLHALDLLFLSNYGPYLGRVTYTITKVQHLLRYINETILAMAAEWKSMESVEGAYMRAHKEIVEAPDDAAAGLEFFELLITGCASERMREWLVDCLGEKGQKKWEKVYVNGYETLRRLTHEHLLPACDRLVVLLSKLRGLARWTDKDSSLGLDPMDYSKLLDLVAGLAAVSHEFMGKVNYEMELFSGFIGWLKLVYEEFNGLAEGGGAADAREREDFLVDTLKVADYIGKHLQNSVVAGYFDKKEWEWKEDENVFELYTKGDGEGSSGREAAAAATAAGRMSGLGSGVKKRERGNSGSFNGVAPSVGPVEEPTELPGFYQLFERMNEVARGVFSKPANAMKQQVHVGESVVVHDRPYGLLDVRLCEDTGASAVWYLAMAESELDEHGKPGPDTNGAVVMMRIVIVKTGTLSSVNEVSCARIELPRGKVASALRFTDNETLLVLLYDEDFTEMVSFLSTAPHVAYTTCPREWWELTATATATGAGAERGVFGFAGTVEGVPIGGVRRHLMFNHNDITPVAVTVNTNRGRRLGSVLDREKLRWIIFDLGTRPICVTPATTPSNWDTSAASAALPVCISSFIARRQPLSLHPQLPVAVAVSLPDASCHRQPVRLALGLRSRRQSHTLSISDSLRPRPPRDSRAELRNTDAAVDGSSAAAGLGIVGRLQNFLFSLACRSYRGAPLGLLSALKDHPKAVESVLDSRERELNPVAPSGESVCDIRGGDKRDSSAPVGVFWLKTT
ncbi:hypothetical protein DRE_03505 [Drechslerella stenobrocha 248]|uniref:Anaphase-promoting complex subunit 4 n=1 Tax=Drechslerella stenobrocha 248 TaxID=1043628 RepID=W7HST9_9PEZI|nr:hypothetical protein DRE_03505 [Drechslerella stenobrocha 248]